MYVALNEANMTNIEHLDVEAHLVARLRAGDETAFEMLVARYQAPLFRYLCSFVGDAEQAHDLVQETFLRAFRSIHTLEEAKTLRGWLYRIAHNLACSLLRRRRLIRWLPLTHDRHTATPSPDRATVEAACVEEALAQVPVDQRAPLLLHLVGGFSYAEVAAMLQLSESTVRMRISRGRASFRRAYDTEEDHNAT
ncbi:MAG: hypothetical protein GFH27_549305n64 [Chloroflexi bacterium AL-W]|nr:hypothetical protein [Chloroflexi bacterium AL-N1]NOK69310.1 hypothetical protein [Chloroflexi bacterium AL-N10]NOK76371.1 hypothetical protein [Chloroflexi bacterium AL-N5]NOK83488.1 hypothetical protein [Chloroflexi bacterium AL-W]NOK91148.1 hypothetical protein [Chloroflexi bacterium AL-N15]